MDLDGDGIVGIRALVHVCACICVCICLYVCMCCLSKTECYVWYGMYVTISIHISIHPYIHTCVLGVYHISYINPALPGKLINRSITMDGLPSPMLDKLFFFLPCLLAFLALSPFLLASLSDHPRPTNPPVRSIPTKRPCPYAALISPCLCLFSPAIFLILSLYHFHSNSYSIS